MKNALLCFLKYPEPGHVKTRLAADIQAHGAADLYAALAERAITEVYSLNQGYDIFLYIDPAHGVGSYKAWIGNEWRFREQKGKDLGDRLENAVQRTFDEGYDRVMVIGSDCVGFSEEFIDQNFAMLDQHDVVIGPSTDGGYYLIGIRENSPWLFEHMAWSTDQVLETTLNRIEARELKVKQLTVKRDIDDLDDLLAFRKEIPEEHFLAKKNRSNRSGALGAEGRRQP